MMMHSIAVSNNVSDIAKLLMPERCRNWFIIVLPEVQVFAKINAPNLRKNNAEISTMKLL